MENHTINHGFSSPVGKLKNIKTSLENMRIDDLAKIGVSPGEKAKLEFESGVLLKEYCQIFIVIDTV